MLKKLLHPKLYVSSIFEIDLEGLKALGIRGFIFDLDNTLLPRDCSKFSVETLKWFEKLKNKGFKYCVVSNNGSSRLEILLKDLKIPYIYKAVKPRKAPFLKAVELLGLKKEEVAVIGDQIFTDMAGGNRAGLYTILVTPLPGKEYWATELINRRLEKMVLRKLKPQNKA